MPPLPPGPKGGRPPVGNREALTGILFVLETGIPREDLPCEMGCGCGMSCRRRLRDWQADGTWDRIHRVLLAKLRGADKIDWSRALIDSSHVRAAYGGGDTGPSPVDRAKPGSKHHVLTDASGIPLASPVTAANRNDVTEMAPLFGKLPAVAGKAGRPRRKPDALQGDRAYDIGDRPGPRGGAGRRSCGSRRPGRGGRRSGSPWRGAPGPGPIPGSHHPVGSPSRGRHRVSLMSQEFLTQDSRGSWADAAADPACRAPSGSHRPARSSA